MKHIEDLEAEVANLHIALETRDVIGQAKGILMERHGIDSREAFERLVVMSQHTNVKLREVAEYLVELRADEPSTESVQLLEGEADSNEPDTRDIPG